MHELIKLRRKMMKKYSMHVLFQWHQAHRDKSYYAELNEYFFPRIFSMKLCAPPSFIRQQITTDG